MKRRRKFAVAAAIGGTVATAGALLFWRSIHKANPAIAGVVGTPDLSRWPQAFSTEVETLIKEVRRGDQPTSALARLATLYFANDLMAEAELALRRLRELEPANPRWSYLLGVLLSRRNEHAEAEKQLRATLNLAPDYSPAQFQLGQALAQAGRDQEALAFYEQRLAGHPDDVLANLGIVDIERRQGIQGSAIRRLEKLLEIRPAAAEARLLLAEMLDAGGNKEAASMHRVEAQRSGVATPMQDPWLDEVYLHSFDAFRLQTLGVMRLQAGAVDEALPYLRRAASLAPEDADVVESFAVALVKSGQADEALSTLEATWERTRAAIVGSKLAELLAAKGETAKAETLLREATDRQPSEAEFHQALGRLLLSAGRAEEAKRSLSEALRLQPTLTDAQLNLGRALYLLGNYDDARRAITRALEMRPGWAEALLALAQLELQSRNWASAVDLAEQTLAVNAQTTGAIDVLGRAALGQATAELAAGRVEAAERIYRDGLLRAPDYGPLHGALAALFGKTGRLLEAQKSAQRYSSVSPKDARAWFLLGVIHEQLGEKEKAVEAYTRGLEVARETGDNQRTGPLEQALRRARM